jgi:hypothetical protein
MLLPVGRSGWAIAAGYLGLLPVLLIPAPLAVAASIIAIADIRRSRTKGEAQAWQGSGNLRAHHGRAVHGLADIHTGVLPVNAVDSR